jgi:tetratricopeptide (TPR) repeat protein
MRISSACPGANTARLAVLAVALSGAGCATHMRFVCPAHGGPEWRQLTTAHVVLRTDLDARQAEAMAQEIELTRALLARAVDLQETGTPDRIEVVAMATREEMFDFLGTRDYVGEATHDDEGRQRLLVAGMLTQDDQHLLIAHEMAHLISLHAIPYQPRWFAEGLATYLSSVARVSADGSRAVGSTPDLWILDWLRFERQVGVRELFGWTGATEPARYAAAWLLIRTLASEHAEALAAFERRLAAFEPAAQAWNQSFPEWSLDRPGGPEALDAILRARARDASGAGRRVTAEIDPRIEARVLTPPEVHTVRLDFPRRWKASALHDEIEEALREDPGHALALARRSDEEASPQALLLARRAVAAHPEDPAAWRLLARRLPSDPGVDLEAARRKVVELAPDRSENLIALADQVLSRDPAEAERLSGRAVALAPWSANAKLVHATALAYVGRCDESSADLRHAQSIHAGRDRLDASAWYAARGVRLSRRCRVPAAAKADPLVDRGSSVADDDPGRALSLADQALDLDPEHSDGWLLRGNALLRLGRLGEAEAAYRRQIEVYPSNPWAWGNLGRVLVRAGRTVEAEAAYRRQLEVDPSQDDARRRLVDLLLELGRPRDAASVVEPARRKAPRNASVALDLGRTLLASGDHRAGMESVEQAIKLAPGPWALNAAAYYLAVANLQLSQASAWAESSVKGYADELRGISGRAGGSREAAQGWSLLGAWDTLGWVRFHQGRLDDAERYVSAAARIYPSGEELEHIGEILDRRGLHADALAAYAQAIAADGNLRARRRLEERTPSADLEPLLSRARNELLRRRILRRGPAPADAAVDSRVLLVLRADGTVADVLPASEGEKAPDGAAALVGTSHGLRFADPRPDRLVVRGRYRCAGGVCAWFLGDDPVPPGPLPE